MKLTRISPLLMCASLASVEANAMSKAPEPEPSQPQAAGYTGDVHGMAQQCFAIQSPETGNYLRKYHKGGAIDNGLSYRFENAPQAQATKFFMKPTSFGKFLLTDQEGRYFASHLPAEISAGRYAGEFAEWTIAKEGGDRFTLKGTALNMEVRGRTDKGTLYFFDLFNPFNFNSERAVKFIAQ